MSDLVERIAATLAATHASGETTFMGLADAVIEALDLGTPCATTGCRMRQIAQQAAARHQVVEDWHGKAGRRE